MMKAWWDQRNQRERLLLSGAAILMTLLLCYALLWLPFQDDLSNLRQRVTQQRSELVRMQQIAAEIRYLEQRARATVAPPAGRSDTTATTATTANSPSLPTLVDQTARAAGLGKALKRVEPQTADTLQIQFEQAGFDTMLGWLDRLLQDHGIVIVNIIVSRQDKPGTVDARLLLQKQGMGS